MNILIAVTQLNRANGGVSTHVVDLCKGLLDLGHKVVVTSNGGEYVKPIEDMEIPHYTIQWNGIQKHPIQIMKAFNLLNKIIKKYNIDIIHTHGQSIIIFAQMFKLLKKIPFVWTNHIDAIAQQELFKKLYKFKHFPIISVSED